MLGALNEFASESEAEIERQCNTNHQEFVTSVNQLLRIREGTVSLTNEILDLNQSIQASTEKLVEQKKALVESRGVRQNIDEASHALQDCLEVLRLANQVHDLLAKKSHYAALRALDELQKVHLQSVTQYSISDMIQKSVPATQKAIAEAVMADLNTWLYRVREMSQYLGELSFYHTDLRKNRQAERAEKRGEKATSGRPAKLCSLSTVEVRKDEEGFQIYVNQTEGRRHFVVTPDQVGPVLRDLETAIQVIRNLQ